MEEAEALADRIAVIVSGRIVAEGRPGTLGGRDRAATRIAFQIPAGATDRVGAALQEPLEAKANGRVSVSTTEPLAELERLAHWSRATATPIADLEVTRPSLEEIYLALTSPTKTANP
jgi:ABC-2 type transport system ATP-binding protein